MSQVHNRSVLLDGNAFGKNSRFMNPLKFSDVTKRRVQAFNIVENRLNRYKLNYYNRQAELEYNRQQRQKETLLIKMKRLIAYKVVTKRQNLSEATEYYESLNEDRTPRAILNEVKDMIKQISPQYMREKRAIEKIEEAKKLCDDVIRKTGNQTDFIYPLPQKWNLYKEEVESLRSGASTPASPTVQMNAELRIRRLTLPQRKSLGVSRAYVMEKSNLGEEKEKTTIESKPPNENLSTSRTDTNEEKKPKYDLPPVIVRKSILKDATQNNTSKRTEKQNYELPPVSVNKKTRSFY